MWPWCIVMSDTRPLSSLLPGPFWSLTARINHAYATLHGYGFAYYQLSEACEHVKHGIRDASWCKIVALAHALMHGIHGRTCDHILYLDSVCVCACSLQDPSMARACSFMVPCVRACAVCAGRSRGK